VARKISNLFMNHFGQIFTRWTVTGATIKLHPVNMQQTTKPFDRTDSKTVEGTGGPTYPRFTSSWGGEVCLARQTTRRRGVDPNWRLRRRNHPVSPRRTVVRRANTTTTTAPGSGSSALWQLARGGWWCGAQQFVWNAAAAGNALVVCRPTRRLASLPNLPQPLKNGVQHEVEILNVELEIIGFKMPGQILQCAQK
jgi:hypothetical protein